MVRRDVAVGDSEIALLVDSGLQTLEVEEHAADTAKKRKIDL